MLSRFRLLKDDEVEEIRAAVHDGRFTLPSKLRDWIVRLLADHDARVFERRSVSPTGE